MASGGSPTPKSVPHMPTHYKGQALWVKTAGEEYLVHIPAIYLSQNAHFPAMYPDL